MLFRNRQRPAFVSPTLSMTVMHAAVPGQQLGRDHVDLRQGLLSFSSLDV